MTRTKKLRMPRTALLALFLSFTLFAAACGSSSDNSSGSASTTVGGSTDTAVSLDKLDQLRIYHPETLAFAAPFTVLQSNGALSEIADSVSIDTWSTPDILRSLVTSNQTDVTAVPTYVGANLYNKGMDVRMAAVTVWGLLYLVGPDGTAAEWESLRGQNVMVPFQNDMPDLVFRYLATENGLTPGKDFTIEYYATPVEVVGRLAGNKGSWAVLPEHVVTLALANAQKNGQQVTRLMNLQDEWATVTGLEPRIPQAGVVVSSAIADNPAVLSALLDNLTSAVSTVNAATPETVELLAQTFELPADVIESLIPRLNLDVVPGSDAREDLERFYTELAKFNPEIIGGELPDESFYLTDPR